MRAVRRKIALAVLAACWAAGSARAESAPPSIVTLEAESCSADFDAALRAILRLELADMLQEGPSRPSSSHEQIVVRCHEDVVNVSARSGQGEVVEHDLRLDAFPGDAAPRATALAALEALTAVDPKYAERIEAQHARRDPKPRAAEPPAATERAKREPAAPASPPERASSRLGVGGVGRWFVEDPGTAAWGARVELVLGFAAPWAAAFDVEGALARENVDLGSVEARLLSIGGWAGPRWGGPLWAGMLGLGGRLGVADLRGGASDASVRDHGVMRWWAGPALVGRVDGALGAVGVALMAEGGYAAAGADGLADGASVLSVRGAWVALSLNAGVRL